MYIHVYTCLYMYIHVYYTCPCTETVPRSGVPALAQCRGRRGIVCYLVGIGLGVGIDLAGVWLGSCRLPYFLRVGQERKISGIAK